MARTDRPFQRTRRSTRAVSSSSVLVSSTAASAQQYRFNAFWETSARRCTSAVLCRIGRQAANQLITAFGQACAYKLFSHRTYLVVPRDASKEDIDRLDALCMIFGIGFILFDSSNAKSPEFAIKVRAAKHEPDSFYVKFAVLFFGVCVPRC